MGDTEEAKVVAESDEHGGGLGFSLGYLISLPGIVRILNIVLGVICIGLWVPGYEHEFLGEKANIYNGDTTSGYGNGYKRETLNQFVLAAIIIALAISVILLIGLVAVQHASVDWNRFSFNPPKNKTAHLFLGIFLFIAGICGACGVWYFQENCCHVDMTLSGLGVRYWTNNAEGYVRHCYCYLTRYLGQSDTESDLQTILYDPARNPVDLTQRNDQWTWTAHHVIAHLAAVFIIFTNSILYFLAFVFSKIK